jgi:biopolymer transport protein ExbD
MASSSKDGDDEVIDGINVTPLVDITLVLLIIMMVTAPLLANQALTMDLPKAAKVSTVQDSFGVDLSPDGSIFVGGNKVDQIENVLPLAKEALAKNKELRANIRSDSTVPWGRVARVVDLLKQAGIARIAFGVTPSAPEPGGARPPAPTNPQ